MPTRDQTRALFNYLKSTSEYLTFLVTRNVGNVVTITSSVVRISDDALTIVRSPQLPILSEVRLPIVVTSTANHEVTVADANSKRVITDRSAVEADSERIARDTADFITPALTSIVVAYNRA